MRRVKQPRASFFTVEEREKFHEMGLEPWPADQPSRYNGIGTPCDMWTGPCCCGATHFGGR